MLHPRYSQYITLFDAGVTYKIISFIFSLEIKIIFRKREEQIYQKISE